MLRPLVLSPILAAMALGCRAPGPAVTEADLVGRLRPERSAPATPVRMTNFNMFGHCEPFIEIAAPAGTTVEEGLTLLSGSAEATLWMGDLGNDPIRSMSALNRELLAHDPSKAFSGGRWTGSGGIAAHGPRREAVYWIESKGEFASLRLSWDPAKPTALSDAKALLDAIVLTAEEVP